MIEVCTVSGYNEVGKNMTAIKVDNEVIILDMGIHLDNYIKYTEDEDIRDISKPELIKVGAIPDDSVIEDWHKNVSAIIPTHGHLDHVGAVAFMCNSYKSPIICTPYTAEIISTIAKDDNITIKNPLKVINSNSKYKLSDKITIEFIHITHSIPQTVLVAIHTKQGIVIYANDFKLDNHPVIGKKPDYEGIEELGKKGVLLLIAESLRASETKKTPSELIAREMLADVIDDCSNNKGIIVTTFSSHLARLKSIIEFGNKIKRKVVFLGRSLAKYVYAGEKAGIIKFSDNIDIVKYAKQLKRRLKEIDKDGREKYLLVVTGHQGEPKSTLSKILNNEIQFALNNEDCVIFSCNVIPSEININNRKLMEEKLKSRRVRIFKDVHVSGHASKEDLRDFISMIKPKHIIPSHGDPSITIGLVELAKEMGYTLGKDVHLMRNGERLLVTEN